MHELSIADSILETVRKERERRKCGRITKVGVRIGELAGVDPDALSFGFEALVKGSDLEPLELEIEFLTRRQECPKCKLVFDVVDYKVDCPSCGTPETRCVSGEELDLAYLEVEES